MAHTSYDGIGRVIQVQKGNGSTATSAVDTEYAPCACSPLGKVKRVSQPYVPGATIYWTTYTYDSLGRTVSVPHPNNRGPPGE